MTLPLIGKGSAGRRWSGISHDDEGASGHPSPPTDRVRNAGRRIWSTTSEGFYTRASFAALVLIAVSAVPLHLLITRDLHD